MEQNNINFILCLGTMRIDFSNNELMQIGFAGIMRRVSAIHKGRKPQHGIGPEREWQADIEGIIGEFALAKALGKFWIPTVGRLDKDQGDVQGYQVRTTHWRNGHLIINKTDYDIFVLITGDNKVGKAWTVRGWIKAADGKQEEWWKSKEKDRFAYFVPQSALAPMEVLDGE